MKLSENKPIWSKIQCSHCGGYGLISEYSLNDFEGAAECNECNGSGSIFVSPKGRLVKWPGGPFVGSLPLFLIA